MARAAAGATVAGIVLGLAGPFGSYLNGPAEQRIGYWVASMWLGLGLYGGALALSWRLIARHAVPPWIVLFGVILLATVPQALATQTLALMIWPDLARLGLGAFGWYVQSLVIAVPVALGYAAWVGAFSAPIAVPVAATAATQSNALFDLLAPGLGRDVLCLAMEDHYVRVHTPLGSALLLLPMGQAVESVRGIDGLRVHRSCWVARNAVGRTTAAGRGVRLLLVNGLEVPVARRMVADLRAAGWLDCVAPA